MFKLKIKVGRYYALTARKDQTIACAVLYGFERGKNKNVYTLRMYTKKGNFEFPIEGPTFDRWVSEGKIKEISAEEALEYSL